MTASPTTYLFDDVRVEVESFRAYKSETLLKIEPKAFRVLLLLLERQGKLVKKNDFIDAVWDGAFVTDDVLSRAISLLRKRLGCDAKKPRYIETVETQGYRFIAQVQESGRGTEAVKSGGVTGDMPRLRWMDELVDVVRDGETSAEVQVLPGNGAEHVCALLEEALSQAKIIEVKLAFIEDDKDLILNIAAATSIEPELVSGKVNYYQIARDAAGGSQHLVLIVDGWGGFEQIKGSETLMTVARMLHGFMKVSRPKVVIVLLSPTTRYHLLPGSSHGSLLPGFQWISPAADDADEIEKWAAQRLKDIGLSEEDTEKLIGAACGQLDALREAVRAAQRSQNQSEWLRAVSRAHAQAGERILSAVGQCCWEVLLGRTPRPANRCLEALESAGILERSDGGYRPRVEAWASSWPMGETVP